MQAVRDRKENEEIAMMEAKAKKRKETIENMKA